MISQNVGGQLQVDILYESEKNPCPNNVPNFLIPKSQNLKRGKAVFGGWGCHFDQGHGVVSLSCPKSKFPIGLIIFYDIT